MPPKRTKPQNPLGLSKHVQQRLIAFHEAGHAVVGAMYGQAVVRIVLDGPVPQVELTRLDLGAHMANFAVLCGGFMGVKAAFPNEGDELHKDGAQHDIGQVEDMAKAVAIGVCEKGVDEARENAEYLNKLAVRHTGLSPERHMILLADITGDSVHEAGPNGIRARLFRLRVFVAQAEAHERLGSKGGRAALHGAAHYLSEKGPKSAEALNRAIANGLCKNERTAPEA